MNSDEHFLIFIPSTYSCTNAHCSKEHTKLPKAARWN